MNESNDLTQVVMRTALIENLLNQAIQGFCAPRKEAAPFFWGILLDSSIIPLAGKIKATLAIAHEIRFEIDGNPLHKLMSYRNAFAHNKIDSHPTLIVREKREEDEMRLVLEIISASGKVRRVARERALVEFNEHHQKAKASLRSLIDEIESLS